MVPGSGLTGRSVRGRGGGHAAREIGVASVRLAGKIVKPPAVRCEVPAHCSVAAISASRRAVRACTTPYVDCVSYRVVGVVTHGGGAPIPRRGIQPKKNQARRVRLMLPYGEACPLAGRCVLLPSQPRGARWFRVSSGAISWRHFSKVARSWNSAHSAAGIGHSPASHPAQARRWR